jgi:GNAT superfamily N-acetyltransferase
MPEIGLLIESWADDHPRWNELRKLIDELGQASWVSFQADWHLNSVLLAAMLGGEPVGFLRYVIQPIGPDMDCPVLESAGKILSEAKILAFGVRQDQRGKGIGRSLQKAAIQSAQALGCYQIRSYSAAYHPENHHLKLSLGFCAHPVVRANGESGIYFILPLQTEVLQIDRIGINF